MEETFPQKIYQLVKTIPSGKVATYGQLALLAGSPRASRIVGAALAKAPAGLPCHRVLYRDGSLCCQQAFGGKEVQRRLLEKEGVLFLPDGRVNLRQCLWQPADNPWNLLKVSAKKQVLCHSIAPAFSRHPISLTQSHRSFQADRLSRPRS